MKEFFDALHTRLKSPVFGYFLLAWLAFNWKALLLLAFAEAPIIERIALFQSLTGIYDLLVYPLVIGALAALAYPWFHLLFLWASHWPTERRNAMEARTEGALLLVQEELKASRARILAEKEQAVIDRAKRDAEVAEIEDEEKRGEVRKELDDLRNQDKGFTEKLGSTPPKRDYFVEQLARVDHLNKERDELDKKHRALVSDGQGNTDEAQNLRDRLATLEKEVEKRMKEAGFNRDMFIDKPRT